MFARRSFLYVFLLPLLTAVPLAGQWQALPSDSLRAILTTRVERGGSTGIVLGVQEPGGPRVVAVGRRGGPGSAPLDGLTVLEIGSVSKVFTTLLLAEMVGRGEVALEDPVQRYLPASVKVPERNGRVITLLDLATATSGLPRLPALQPTDPTNPYLDYRAEQLYAFLNGYTLPRDPGASYEYSNLGMGLLGHALERRAGKPYEALVTERLLEPLGMRDTRITLTAPLAARLAQGHDVSLEPVRTWEFDVLAGAGAWRSTVNDMLRFMAACVSPPAGRVGDAIRLAIEPKRPAVPPNLSIGLGWHVLQRNGKRIVWHNGQTGGYHSFVGFDPASGANVVVLSASAGDIDDIGLHVLDGSVQLRHPAPARPEVAVPEATLRKYVGRYELAPTFVVEVTAEGEKLFVQATNQPRFRVYPASATRFFLKVVEAEVEFLTDSAGTATALVLHQGGRSTPGARLPGR